MTSSKRTVEFFWLAMEMAFVIAIACAVILLSYYIGQFSARCIQEVPAYPAVPSK
jgi:hypothetical protein